MKVLVPPAPESSHLEKPRSHSSNPDLIEGFDEGFVGRIMVSMLGLGALGMLGVLGATNSPLLAGSFFGGVVLGALLLKSQEWFVRRVLGPRAPGEKSFKQSVWRRAPLGIILPLKYLVVGAVLGISIDAGWLQAQALAVGFVASQMVIGAKVVGRFAALKLRA